MPIVLEGFIISLVVTQIGIFCTTVWLHRALSHKALSFSKPVTTVFRIVTWMTTGIRPRQWVAVHRKHHAFTDVPGDPHSPILLGYWKVQIENVLLYRDAAKDDELVGKYAKDLPPDKWDKALLDHAVIGLGIGIGLLCLVFGWQVGLIAAGFHTVIYLMLNSAVNAVGHTFGKKTYQNTARNNQWLAWLTAGEGLHNNHHAAPTSARLALDRGEIDPGWWLIRMLVRFKQADIRLAEAKIASPKVSAGPG